MATDNEIISEAKEAHKLGLDAEADNRESYIADYRFARLDEHWPEEELTRRKRDARPCLTIPRLPAFLNQVINDSRQNRPRIRAKPVIDEKVLMHRCDVPECVNPDHLIPGTTAENNADMQRKGRQGYPNSGSFSGGENHPRAVLNAKIVRFMRASGLKAKELAQQFNVTPTAVRNILAGKAWKNVNG